MSLRILPLALLSVCAFTAAIAVVHATTITSLSSTSGLPGTSLTLIGSINTVGGYFIVYFDETSVFNQTSTGEFGYVTATFTVPGTASQGTHTVTLSDTEDHSTASAQFNVIPNATTITITTTTAAVPEPTSVIIGAIAGSGVVAAAMTTYVLGRNNIIRRLQDMLKRCEESTVKKPPPPFDSINIQVRTGTRRLEDTT